MHQTSQSSSAPRRAPSSRLASLIQTASVQSRPLAATGGSIIGNETPATSRSRSISVCGIAWFVFEP